MLRMTTACCLLLQLACLAAAPGAVPMEITPVAPGVWRCRFGQPEALTPTHFRSAPIAAEALAAMPAVDKPPLAAAELHVAVSARGCSLRLPLGTDEGIYGLGLNTRWFEKSGRRQMLIPSDGPEDPAGPSHAPVPFYVSTAGYGVYVDTARFATFNVGNVAPVEDAASGAGAMADNTADLYRARGLAVRHMLVEAPAAQGVDVYLFAGPALLDAVRRYVLFAGGGAVPPLWGLGMVYRGKSDFGAADGLSLARKLREQHIPCDVFGLEPGWQTKAYSCSFVWDKGRFPDPDAYLRQLRELGFHVSVWQHAFTHPDSPIHEALRPMSGDYRVWGGLVPDFALPEARRIFSEHHQQVLFGKGVDAVKLDECDYQPFGPEPWSFPTASRFPSGLDGEQMHSLFGLLYQQTLLEPLTAANRRTWGLVRQSGALAAPLPYVVYSDSYDHRCYVRGLANQGFGGLLWVPEVREASSLEDLYRRVQTVIFSPLAQIDPWYMKLPPWQQINAEKSNRGEVMPEAPEATVIVRRLLELRMSLVPYLYAAFNEYRLHGTPPIRALIMDWPGDPAARGIDDQFMCGPSLLVAPLFAGQASRQVYLPRGRWCDFWTNEILAGGRSVAVRKPLDQMPLYVREGAILPLARPVEHIAADTVFELEARVYGTPTGPYVLYEDDGLTNDYLRGQQCTVI
ncbi:MAG: glycoside hydrolase [Armatimonadetes bacterium]|nr:glycoside hydrolase [Armatimonadota bacterium]